MERTSVARGPSSPVGSASVWGCLNVRRAEAPAREVGARAGATMCLCGVRCDSRGWARGARLGPEPAAGLPRRAHAAGRRQALWQPSSRARPRQAGRALPDFSTAWGTSLDLDAQSVAANLFAASIVPYSAFLYFLHRSRAAPPLALFGFYFLLVFVFGTIPAGIYAKTHYNSILANVDYLHGSAESLLTVTNLFIGARRLPARTALLLTCSRPGGALTCAVRSAGAQGGHQACGGLHCWALGGGGMASFA